MYLFHLPRLYVKFQQKSIRKFSNVCNVCTFIDTPFFYILMVRSTFYSTGGEILAIEWDNPSAGKRNTSGQQQPAQ
jgi:hypothetical protein